MAMWVELQFISNSPKGILIVDNCGCHHVHAIKKIFTANVIILKTLPINMTDKLQPMDLVVNKVVKSRLRQERISQLEKHFNEYRNHINMQLSNNISPNNLTKYKAPKPKLITAIKCMVDLDWFNDSLTDQSFQRSLSKSFINSGWEPMTNDYNEYAFRNYNLNIDSQNIYENQSRISKRKQNENIQGRRTKQKILRRCRK
mmetsp:Transcript_7194/g.6456  ORF Transcript_7194/g.6456 Transcript_7194/m.6456 type:complete len:201 (+) Transcript_7194:1-603(+)